MFIARQDIRSNYDIVVVGAGPAGLVFARRFHELVGNTKRVLIVESGDELNSMNEAQKLSAHQASGDLSSDYYPLHNQRMLGGTTTVWNGYCSVLEKRSFMQGEWPIDYSELESFYPDAASILQVPEAVYKYPEATFTKSENIVYKPYFLSPPKRFGDNETRAWLSNSETIDVLTNSTVFNLSIAKRKLDSIVIRSSSEKDNFEKTVFARKVVLATGGIQNARVLQRAISNTMLPALGKYFCEHPHVYRQLDLILDYEQFESISNSSHRNVVHAVAFSSKFSKEQSLLSTTFDLANLTIQSDSLAGRRCKVVKATSTIRSEMKPLTSNSISISERSNDYLGQGVANVHLEFNTNEIERSVRAMSEQLLRSGLGRLSLLPKEYEVTGGGHMMGTTRMGLSTQTSVVDSNCRVHGVGNLYIAGSSVYPASAAANPTLTIVALSLRLAHHLASLTPALPKIVVDNAT